MQRNMILENLIVITKIQNKKLMDKKTRLKNKTTWSKVQSRFQQNTMQFDKQIQRSGFKKTTPQSIHHHASKSGLQNYESMFLFLVTCFFVVLLMLVFTVFVDLFFNMVFVWNSQSLAWNMRHQRAVAMVVNITESTSRKPEEYLVCKRQGPLYEFPTHTMHYCKGNPSNCHTF